MSEQIAAYKKDRDAFGHMLMDFHQGQETFEIIERDDGFMDAEDHVGAYFAAFEAWHPHEQEAARHLLPGRVLDLGCGAGRAELYLQKQGYEVVGIDISPLAVEVCRQRGVKDARCMSITQVGPALGQFDDILMLGNNWGLMGSQKRAKWLLRRFYRMTSPEARIIATSNDVYQTQSPIHLAYHTYNRERGRMAGQIRMRVRCGPWQTEWFDYLMVSRQEMEGILSGTGWQAKEYISSEGPAYAAVIEKIAKGIKIR